MDRISYEAIAKRNEFYAYREMIAADKVRGRLKQIKHRDAALRFAQRAAMYYRKAASMK